ncbi:MAG: ribosomal RNA small subunit methyltransferase A [bacterium]|nr:ribosomal RNA small subunit methyltransferase A [bacterium]
MAPAKLGQNFLVNKNVSEKIVRFFLPVNGPILEVGPGKGVLTELLVKYAQGNPIKAVELDTSLFYKLRSLYPHPGNFEVVNRNILKVDPASLFPGEEKINLISNVPYYISGDFIDWVISRAVHIKKGTLMLQKEFVDRLAAGPGSKDYGAQGIVFNYLFRLEKAFDVSPGSFSPRPKVKSTVFSFRLNQVERVVDTGAFYLFLQACFRNRRKTLLNNLEKRHHSETLWEVFEARGINHKIRAEQLSLDDFLEIHSRL